MRFNTAQFFKATLTLGLIFGLSSANAADLKVLKIKGRKAIVQVPAGMDVQPGDMISISDDGGATSGGSSMGSGGRSYRVDGAFTYTSSSNETKSSVGTVSADTTTMSLLTEAGMNMGSFEFGPLLEYTSRSTTGSDTTDWTIGGFFEYNIFENKVGVSLVPFVGASFGYATADNGSGATSSGLDMEAYGGVKWFPLSETLAVVPTLRYQMQSRDNEYTLTTLNSTTTATNIIVGLGLAKYF